MRTFDTTRTPIAPSAEEIRAVTELMEEVELQVADPPLFEPKAAGLLLLGLLLALSHGVPKEPTAPRS
ncbi:MULTISPECIES: hypothetical protein [Actinoalloteichus]|uniref:Uncharacterized protein n=1 Tax=Actinoalloteichus fjordicus TaxID=1612552 RepID=A0AAC9PSM2_9PSEU|nr:MULTISPECIES: hypothetical protein [Actinoalloteichus]APU15155.1 hypothetical protein UA74_15510 [Actinoalloteichus fjordicus]APU21224.1 hypothetical protein UA75_16075 [Actinoalloteichus sp. GBA129-24]